MSTSYDEKYEDAYVKDWKQQEEERITNDEHAPENESHTQEDWDFDPKCRTGSISEETPDEKRRREFYAANKIQICDMTEQVMMDESCVNRSQCINIAALIISEIAKRAGEDNYLKPGDPEFGDASCIDEL